MKNIVYKRIIKIDYSNIDLEFLIRFCKDLKIIKNNLQGEKALEKIFEIGEITITKGLETSIISFVEDDEESLQEDNSYDDIDSDVDVLSFNQSYEG